MRVLPDAKVLTDTVLLKDGAGIGDVDGWYACLRHHLVGDSARVIGRVTAGDVNGDLFLAPPGIVGAAFNLNRNKRKIQKNKSMGNKSQLKINEFEMQLNLKVGSVDVYFHAFFNTYNLFNHILCSLHLVFTDCTL